MIHLTDVSLSFGGKPILDRLSWHIKANRRIGLIGPNGAGKSTLLRLISGIQSSDEGTFSRASATTIGYLHQDVQEMDTSQSVFEAALGAFEEVLSLEREVLAITRQMEEIPDHDGDPYHRLLHRLERVQNDLMARDAHRIESDTRAILAGLGFEDDEMDRPLSTFSGGWRMRAVLARMLLRRPDVLLLDEPTNHLDIESIDWLEDYLKTYRGTVVLVSHDRYFLDRMVDTIAELANGRITEYIGNYTHYLEEREERRRLHAAAYFNQQKEIADIERFVERFRAKATKARQVQSRAKQLEKMDRLPPPPSEDATIRFRFPVPPRSGRVVLDLSTFSKVYHQNDGFDTPVFADARPLSIARGDKIALIGKNGAGKSTLARIVLGNEPFVGTRTVGHNTSISYFAQHQADTLDPNLSVLDSLRSVAKGQDDTQIRGILGAFLFSGDDVFKPVAVLSGGERSRVALAKSLLSPANFMILDEPTNHLDIQSIKVLVEALRNYEGTFLVVSHDRHFLDQVTNRVWYVGHGAVRDFPGTYSEFHWTVEQERATLQAPQPGSGSAERNEPVRPASDDTDAKKRKTKEDRRREAEERNRVYQERVKASGKKEVHQRSEFKLKEQLRRIEQDVASHEERRTEIETMLADPNFFKDSDRSTKSLEEFSKLEIELNELYQQWETIAGELEGRTV